MSKDKREMATTQTKPSSVLANPFERGNELWKLRGRSGLRPKFETPDELLEAVVDYFKWVDDNPFMEDKVFQFEGRPVHAELKKMRPYTRTRMADHIGVSDRAWRQWRDERPDLLPVIEWAEEVCDNQMLEGAIVGQFNANIISRLLGLVDTRRPHIGLDRHPSSPEFSLTSRFTRHGMFIEKDTHVFDLTYR
ncbi:MAG: terminase small subunit [Paracoccaceae bacterium]